MEGHLARSQDVRPSGGLGLKPSRGILTAVNGPGGGGRAGKREGEGFETDDGSVDDARDADGASSQSSAEGEEEEEDDLSEKEDESEEEEEGNDDEDEYVRTFDKIEKKKGCKNTRKVSANYRGVYWDEKKRAWFVRVRNSSIDSWLSDSFEKEKDAAKAYDRECKRRGWDGAIFNFIDGQLNPLAKPRQGSGGKVARGRGKGKARATPKARDAPPKPTRGSFYRGVTRGKTGKKHLARLSLPNHQREYLGSHDTEEAAAKAYDEAAKRRWGKMAVLNFNPDGTLNEHRHTIKRGLPMLVVGTGKERAAGPVEAVKEGGAGDGEGSGDESGSDLSTVAPPEVTPHSDKSKTPGRHNRTSVYRGVTKDKKTHKFIVRLHLGKDSVYLGTYLHELEAARAYDTAAKERLGDQAILNFLPNGDLNPNRAKMLRRSSLDVAPSGPTGRGSPRGTDKNVGGKKMRKGSEEEEDDEMEQEEEGGRSGGEQEEEGGSDGEQIEVLSVDPDEESEDVPDGERGSDGDDEGEEEEEEEEGGGEGEEAVEENDDAHHSDSVPYKGVTRVAPNRFRASYYVRGEKRTVVIGRFNTPEQAAKAYDTYVVEHGQDAVRNFLADGSINPDRMKTFRGVRRPRAEPSSPERGQLSRGNSPQGESTTKRRRIESERDEEEEEEQLEEGWRIGVRQAVRLLKTETFRRAAEEEVTPDGHGYQRLWATLEQMDSSHDTCAYTERLMRFLRTNVCPSFDADSLTGKPKVMNYVVNQAAWVLAELGQGGKASGARGR